MLLLYGYLQLFDFDVRPLWVDDSTLIYCVQKTSTFYFFE